MKGIHDDLTASGAFLMTARTLVLLALVLVLNGCGGAEHRILGTDIPLVPGTALQSNDFKSSRGRVESGEVEFTGSIFDALERARWTGRGFEKDGWTQESLTGTPEQATAVFTQPLRGSDTERVATLDVVASQVRGVARITISERPIASAGSKPKDTSKPASSAGDPAGDPASEQPPAKD